MKKINSILSALALMTAGMLAGCNEEQELPPIAYPDGGTSETTGTGAWDNPYRVWQVLSGADSNGEPAWVTGYIVGYVTTEDGNAKMNEATTIFSNSGVVPLTNIIMADDPAETDWEKCIPVQLPSGGVRNALNLSSNPGNLGQQVTIRGTTGAKYFSIYGVRSVDAYEWGDKGYYIAPPTPPQPDQKFTAVNSLQSGYQYLLVAGGKYCATAPAESYNYGYLTLTEVTPVDGIITISLDNAFTFTKEGDYWIMQDCYGKYVYLEGNYNSFQVSKTKPAANYLWNITIAANGEATIMNVSMNKWIQYSTTYGSYGCYNSVQGLLPVFYGLLAEELQ